MTYNEINALLFEIWLFGWIISIPILTYSHVRDDRVFDKITFYILAWYSAASAFIGIFWPFLVLGRLGMWLFAYLDRRKADAPRPL